MNITREDCIALCGLTEAEVEAIAEHEHIPDIAAAALGSYLLHEREGTGRIKAMIVDDIRAALKKHDRGHARALLMALREFVAEHRRELESEQSASGSA
jgi:hypothetical protein